MKVGFGVLRSWRSIYSLVCLFCCSSRDLLLSDGISFFLSGFLGVAVQFLLFFPFQNIKLIKVKIALALMECVRIMRRSLTRNGSEKVFVD